MFKTAFAHPFGQPITARTFRRLDLMFAIFLVLLLFVLLSLVSPAKAASCNTIFLTDKNGNISFPFCPPNRAAGTAGGIDNMAIGQSVPAPGNFSTITRAQATPAAVNAAATLTAAQMSGGIITSAPAAAIALTLPLATAMDTAFPGVPANFSIDLSVINTSTTAANTDTMTTNTGWTLVGGMIVPGITPTTGVTPSSALFRATRTGAGAWTLYRIS